MNNLFEQFHEFTQQFVSQKCWKVTAGVVGSLFELDFGKKCAYDVGTRDGVPSIWGEFGISGGCAEWRVDDRKAGQVLATSRDSNQEGGPMLDAIRKLVGATITAVTLRAPGLDCSIEFDNGLALEIFSVEIEFDNYTMSRRDLSYRIDARSVLTVCKSGKQVRDLGDEETNASEPQNT